jgi:chromosome segregation ATPase
MTTPSALSVDALATAITQYRTQHEQITAQLALLDQNRVLAVKTQDTLTGAIAALEQVLQNVRDEEMQLRQEEVNATITSMERDSSVEYPSGGLRDVNG